MMKRNVCWSLTRICMLFKAQHELVQNKRIRFYRDKHMDATELLLFFTVLESLEKALLLRDTALAFSFIIHVTFSPSLHYLVGSNLQTDCRRQFFFSSKAKINRYSNSILSRSSFYIMSGMFCFLRPENKFNRLSLMTNMLSTFHSTDVTIFVGVIFSHLRCPTSGQPVFVRGVLLDSFF